MLFQYGIDWQGPQPDHEWDGESVLQDDSSPVEVPAIELPILDSEIQACLEQNNPLAERQSHGLDIYLNIVLCLHKK